MKILALEFSSARRSVAVLEETTVLASAMDEGDRATPALGMTQRVLDEAHVNRDDIQRIAVGLGPGSYGGVRSAIALAQGWQLAADVEIAGISSARALAAQAWHDGLRGTAFVAIDAQKREFYLSAFELGPAGFAELEPLKLVPPAVLESLTAAHTRIIGHGIQRWFPEAQEAWPTATALGRLGASVTRLTPGEQLIPIYLRETSFVKAPPPRVIPPLPELT